MRQLPNGRVIDSIKAKITRIDMLPYIERSNYLIGKIGKVQWVEDDLCGVWIYAAGQFECPTFHRDELEEVV